MATALLPELILFSFSLKKKQLRRQTRRRLAQRHAHTTAARTIFTKARRCCHADTRNRHHCYKYDFSQHMSSSHKLNWLWYISVSRPLRLHSCFSLLASPALVGHMYLSYSINIVSYSKFTQCIIVGVIFFQIIIRLIYERPFHHNFLVDTYSKCLDT